MEDGFLQISEDFILVYIQSLPNIPQTPEAALTPLLILKCYLVPSLFWRYSPCFRGLGAGSAQAFNTLQALSLPHSLQLPLMLPSPHIAVHFDIHPLCTISPRPHANTTSSLGTSAWTVHFFSLHKALNPALNIFCQEYSLSSLFNTSLSYTLFKEDIARKNNVPTHWCDLVIALLKPSTICPPIIMWNSKQLSWLRSIPLWLWSVLKELKATHRHIPILSSMHYFTLLSPSTRSTHILF